MSVCIGHELANALYLNVYLEGGSGYLNNFRSSFALLDMGLNFFSLYFKFSLRNLFRFHYFSISQAVRLETTPPPFIEAANVEIYNAILLVVKKVIFFHFLHLLISNFEHFSTIFRETKRVGHRAVNIF